MPLVLKQKSTGISSKMIPATNVQQIHQDGAVTRQSKRRSSGSPKGQQPLKRTAFGNITNAKIVTKETGLGKKRTKMLVSTKKQHTDAALKKQIANFKTLPTRTKSDVLEMSSGGDDTEISQSSSSQSSVTFASASSSPSTDSDDSVGIMNQRNMNRAEIAIKDAVAAISLQEKPDYNDIDEENKDDTSQSPVYAQDIFVYLKDRELLNPITSYFDKQPELNHHMRAVLVDWLVEVQENFELNHETLYLAVKLVDRYLMVETVTKDQLQLLGATALFIACKYDERCPPSLDDFKYICDDAYTRQQFIHKEMAILRILDFDLGIPLSYRFLRRYAKCAHASIDILTLARFILEHSLMESQFMETRDSMMAAGCLLLAFKMTKKGQWSKTLVHYSGFEVHELSQLVKELNSMIAKKPNAQLMTIRNKYSHSVFHEVAKLTPMDVLIM